jgi:hypothetical protein
MGILKIKDFKASAIFLENSRKAVEQMSGYDSFLPENFKQISNDLFSLEGVYASDSLCINEKYARTDRSLSDKHIINSVKGYLDLGAEVHMYCYYGLRQGVVGRQGMINTYWWRFITIKK